VETKPGEESQVKPSEIDQAAPPIGDKYANIRTVDQWGRTINPDTLKSRQEFFDLAKPGLEFSHKDYKGQTFKVQDDGTLLNSSGRKMGNVLEMANTIKPGDVTWLAPVPQQPKGGGPATTQAEQVPPATKQEPVDTAAQTQVKPSEIDQAAPPIGDKSAPPAPSLPQPKTHEEIESLPKESLYGTTAGGKKFIAVRGEGKRGGGDRLFETIEEAKAHVENQRVIDQQTEDNRKKREAVEAEEAKMESDYVASFQGFHEGNPREFGRAENS
jgi:hypothetical protein